MFADITPIIRAEVMRITLSLLTFFALCNGAYVPGTPGGEWTKEELMIVKAKLYKQFQLRPLAPKAVRLGFHDCLKYADGSGGCDGCLNWHNVGRRIKAEWVSRSAPNVGVTDNNGLGGLAKRLEEIYTMTNYPKGSPQLAQSLQETGKSRADLWAYASMIGVEFGIDMTNIACKNRTDPRVRQRTCVHDPNTEECFVRPSRPFIFQSGRADCTEFDPSFPYRTSKQEHHPSPLDNGQKTVAYFKDDFGFTGQETAAIFGAHTFGNPHFSISLFPYTWTSSGTHLFNNDYYKGITGQDRWFFNDNTCYPTGDAYGNRPKSRWVAHARAVTKRGGPIFWIHENLVCPNPKRYDRLSSWEKKCVDEAEEGMVCKADPRDSNGNDLDVNGGCEQFRFISGIDEIAMNCEMGLYREFEVDDGIIHGCPGLEHFNETMSAPGEFGKIGWSMVDNRKAEPLCEKQRLEEPAGSTPLYKVMEEYADNQTTWIDHYFKAHEKMVSNGYAAESLTTAPDHYTGITCPLPASKSEHTYCFEMGEATGITFKLANRLAENAGKVVIQNGNSLAMVPESESPNQLWQIAGNHVVNVGTKEPMRINGSTFWVVDEEDDNGDVIIKDKMTGKVMDAWPCRDGKDMVTFQKHGGANQKFVPLFSM